MNSVIERNCKTPHCPNPAIRSDYCPSCQKEKSFNYRNQRKEKLTVMHGSNFYHSTVWRKLRDWFIRNNPVCVAIVDGQPCNQPGEHVDHIKPISQGGSLTLVDNLQTLCASCHSIKTRKEQLSQ